MSILGLDLGTKTIGIAKSDATETIATGMITLKRQNHEYDLEQLIKIITDNQIDQVVMGLPKNMDGSLGAWGLEVELFAKKLEKSSGVEVVLWDERLTTAAAERVLLEADMSRRKRKKVINTQAAVIILQNYLDYCCQRRKTGHD